MSKVIGIDLGTTNSCVAIMDGSEPKVIINEEGARTTPSVVAYLKDDVSVGQAAHRQAITNPENTVYSAKRLIGMKYEDLGPAEKNFPFKVVKLDNGSAGVEIRGKKLTAQEISAKVLQKMKKAAEEYLGEPVTKAVITVPAYFNDSQRQATKDAGKIAGLEVLRIVNEPTAAALAYGLNKKAKAKIVVFDCGGGTHDVSVLDIEEDLVEVLSTNGDTHLGGDDVDNLVMDWIVAEFKKTSGVDLAKDKMALQRLKDAAEKAKIELSSSQSTKINIPFVTADASGPKHLDLDLSLAKFEQMIGAFVDKTIAPCKQALTDAGLNPNEIDEVILVGGSTRIPLLQKRVKELFGKEPNRSVNPDEAVALGAAVQAGILTGTVKDLLLLDVTPLTLGIETMGGVMTALINKNTTIPTRQSQVFSTAADGQTSVECVVLQGERKLARDNRLLGRFHLDGIPPAPRGIPQIEVTYDIDANGILNVHAKDKATGKEQKVTITASSGLSKDEIARMQDEAQRFEEEDKKKVEQITLRNNADTMAYQIDKTLTENEAKIPDDVKATVRAKLDTLKDALKGEDYEAIKTANEELVQASFKMSEILYKSAETPPDSAATPESPPTQDDNVIDAEVVE
jgi:molecular chaperone DnaK